MMHQWTGTIPEGVLTVPSAFMCFFRSRSVAAIIGWKCGTRSVRMSQPAIAIAIPTAR